MSRSRYSVSKLRRSLRRIPEELRKDIAVEMEASSRELLDEVRERAPVDEGRLKENAHRQVSRDGLSAVVGYSPKRSGFKRRWLKGGFSALWQEFGARQHPAQPFLQPAFRSKLHEIIHRIDRAVDRVLKRARDFGR